MKRRDAGRRGPAVGEAMLPGRLQLPRAGRQQTTEAARAFRQSPTPSERLLWEALRGGPLGGNKFRRQQPIGPFIVDFACPSQRLIVEVGGPVHDSQADQDQIRQNLLESRGYRVLRVRAQDVENDLQSVLRSLTDTLTRSWIQPPPLPRAGEGAGG